jgi:hypothetical protein
MEIPEEALAVQRSGVHVVFGPNSAGKSRLLKLLSEAGFSTDVYWWEFKFHPEQRVPDAGGRPMRIVQPSYGASAVLDTKDFEFVLHEFSRNGSHGVLPNAMLAEAQVSPPSWPRRYVSANRYFRDSQEINRVSVDVQNLSIENAVLFLGELFNHVTDLRRAMFDEIARAFHEITGYTFHVRQSGGTHVAQIGEAGRERPLIECGDGLRDLAMLLLFAVTEPTTELFVDDPGIRLHPAAQRRLLSFLLKHSKDRAIWIATHDAVFLSAREVGLRLAVTRVDGVTKVRALTGLDEMSAALGEAGWRATDLLFSDSVLLCEGPSDRTLFRAAIERYGGVDLAGVVVAELGGGLKGKSPEHAVRWLRTTFSQAVPNGKIAALLDSGGRGSDARLCEHIEALDVPVSTLKRGELEEYWASSDEVVIALVVDRANGSYEDPAPVPTPEDVRIVVDEVRPISGGIPGLEFLKRVFNHFKLDYHKVEAAEFVALRCPLAARDQILGELAAEIRDSLAKAAKPRGS